MDYTITYRKKDKGWQFIINFKVNGRWKQKSKQGFNSKKDAKIHAIDFIEKNPEFFLTESKLIGNQDITLKELLLEFVLNQQVYLSPSTLDNMRYSIQSFAPLYNMKVSDITENDLQECITTLLEKGFKHSTLKSKIGYCRSLFNFAIDKYSFIKDNPAKNLKLPKDVVPAQRRALDREEEDLLLSSLKSSKQYSKYYITALICLKAGLRIGEVGGLQFKDINFENRTISINKQWKMISYAKINTYAKFGIGPLKSKNSNRVIPLPNILYDVLLELSKSHKSKDFIVDFGEKRSFQTTMNRDIKKLGFNVCIHEFRHTYATKLIKAGIDFKTVAYLMGHSLRMTLEVYSHVTPDMINVAKKIMDENL